MGERCRACVTQIDGEQMVSQFSFTGWLDAEPFDRMWTVCDGCGLHLFDGRAAKACGLPGWPGGFGDLQMGCEHCHAVEREQAKAEQDLHPERNARLWSPWEDLAIVRLYGEGKSLAEIGEQMQRTGRSVKERLHVLQFRKFREQKLAWYRTNFGTRPNGWSLGEITKMLDLVDEGKSNTQIAAFLGRTPAAINRKLFLLGNPRGEPECLYCQTPLVHTGRKGKKRKYCSDECCRHWHNEMQKQARSEENTKRVKKARQDPKFTARRQIGELHRYPCVHCKNKLAPAGFKYCSDECKRWDYYARAAARAKEKAGRT